MIYDVILSREEDKYVARVKEWTDVVVESPSREKAIRQVRERLADYLTHQVEVVQIEVESPVTADNPWIRNFGRFKDDPTFDDLETIMTAHRRELDGDEKQ